MTPGLGDLTPSFGFCGHYTYIEHIHTCKQNAVIHKRKIKYIFLKRDLKGHERIYYLQGRKKNFKQIKKRKTLIKMLKGFDISNVEKAEQ